MRKLTTEEFIEKANKIHDNKYDYSQSKYINKRTKIKIICPEHGEFWQLANNHIHKKNGCKECSKITTKKFIEKAKKIHGNKYSYDKTVYINAHTKVCIVCPKHGEFWQEPNCHITKKQNCPFCSKAYKGNIKTFIQFSKEVHGNKYDYSKVEYANSQTKVKIICPIHGEFWQKPGDHINRANGCPICRMSNLEKNVISFLNKNDINFSYQKKFDNCKNKNCLSFDFYLPYHNLLIECDGRQHFEPIEHFGGIENFQYTKKNDEIKTNFAKQNDINLLRIPYYDINKIKEILKEKINDERTTI